MKSIKQYVDLALQSGKKNRKMEINKAAKLK